jgi:hypothetical protein
MPSPHKPAPLNYSATVFNSNFQAVSSLEFYSGGKHSLPAQPPQSASLTNIINPTAPNPSMSLVAALVNDSTTSPKLPLPAAEDAKKEDGLVEKSIEQVDKECDTV